MGTYLDITNFYILAHRGGAANKFPENSLDAFEHSIQQGYHYLETDVRLAEDDKLHLAHRASSLLPNQLLKLNNQGSPTLDQLFDRFPTRFFAIDPKHDLAIEPLAELIVAKGKAGQVCIGSSFDSRAKRVAALVEAASGVRPATALVSALATGRFMMNSLGLPIHKTMIGASFIHVNHRFIRPAIVRAAHDHGLKLIAWVVNDRPTMEKLISWQVDGFMTDYLELTRGLI